MKVSVFNVKMSDGSGGTVMVPCTGDAMNENILEEAFRKSDGGSAVHSVMWDYNMWVSDVISGPTVLKVRRPKYGKALAAER